MMRSLPALVEGPDDGASDQTGGAGHKDSPSLKHGQVWEMDATTWPSVVPVYRIQYLRVSLASSQCTVRKKRAMRTTGVSGRLFRLAVVMVPMFGLMVAGAGSTATGPARSARAGPRRRRRCRWWWHLVVDHECRRGLLAEAAGRRAHAGRTGEGLHPAAGLSHGARRRRAGRHQPGGDRVRRQRPDVRRRARQLHARRRRQQPARARQPHHPLGEHEGRRRLRQAHRLRRQARAAAHHPAARRQAS